MFANSSAVTKHFGYWPSFCDARVEAISFSLPGTIELRLFYIDSGQNKSAHVALRFTGVTDLELNELRNDNVIDEPCVAAGSPMVVEIISACGLSGRFSCSSAEVVHANNA